MHFRILKMIATSALLTALEYTKFVFGQGSAPDPAEVAYSTPRPRSWFKGALLLRGGKEKGRKGVRRGGAERGWRGGKKSRNIPQSIPEYAPGFDAGQSPLWTVGVGNYALGEVLLCGVR